MDKHKLEATAKLMVKEGKGLIAADESSNSCKKRFDAVGVECTEDTRRQYRQILLTTPDIQNYLSGAILYDETFWQKTDSGQLFTDYLVEHGILPGIKVDGGLIDMPGFDGEKLTQGLDGLAERMEKYQQAGAKFAKWRAVVTIGSDIPTDACIDANAFVLAQYARICQNYGIVPIVEPEVLFDGQHSIETCQQVVQKTYKMLFELLRYYRVYLPGLILKTSMVLPGKDSGIPINNLEVAERTALVLKNFVPQEIGGVVFLSGGQETRDAFINLNKIKQAGPYNFGLTFSFSRAIQDSVLRLWAENRDPIKASEIYTRQLYLAQQATLGKLDESVEFDNFVSHSQDL